MDHERRVTWRRIGLAMALIGLAQVGGQALARERQQQVFTSPSAPGAAGRARLTMQSASDGRLDLSVRGLAPDQTFDVLVSNVKVGTLRTTGGGQGAVRFRTRPRGHDLMLGFDPHGALLTIRDAAGNDVLVTQLPAGSTPSPDKVICCIPDNRGDECEDRTADECTAQSGTVAAATSCLPNPCENAPPVQTEVICCVPDDSGAECEDRTPAECSTRGGMTVSATSCDPNPCAPTPPADPEIQCCIPDDGGAECEDRTPAQCTAQGGTNMGAGTCTPNPCAASSTAASGADDSGGQRSSGGGGGGGHHGGNDGGGDNHGGAVGGTYYGVAIPTSR